MSAHLPGRGPAGTGRSHFGRPAEGTIRIPGPLQFVGGVLCPPLPHWGAPRPFPHPPASSLCCRRNAPSGPTGWVQAERLQSATGSTSFSPDSPPSAGSLGRRGATADSSPEEAPSSAREAGGAPRAGTAGPGPRRENEGRACSKSKAFHSPQCPQSGRPAPLLVHPCLRPKLQGALFLGQGTVTTVP